MKKGKRGELVGWLGLGITSPFYWGGGKGGGFGDDALLMMVGFETYLRTKHGYCTHNEAHMHEKKVGGFYLLRVRYLS